MSEIRKVWKLNHLKHLKKRAAEGAADEVIATELQYIKADDVTGFWGAAEDVKAKREELKLPPEAAFKSLSAYIRPSKADIVSSQQEDVTVPEKKMPLIKMPSHPAILPAAATEKALSKAQVFAKTRASKANKPAQDFSKVAGPEKVSLSQQDITLEFKAAAPAKYEKGKIYVYPKTGPVLYVGKETMQSSALGTIETLVFKELYVKNPTTVKLLPAQLEKQGMRALISSALMKDIMSGMETGKVFQAKPKAKVHGRLKEYAEILVSGNPLMISSLACWMFKSKDETSNASYGNKAIHLLAAEYAAIHNSDYDMAVQLLEKKVSKPSLQQLSENRARIGGEYAKKPTPEIG